MHSIMARWHRASLMPQPWMATVRASRVKNEPLHSLIFPDESCLSTRDFHPQFKLPGCAPALLAAEVYRMLSFHC